MAKRYRFTSKRAFALKKAQAASARKRKRNFVLGGVGVLAIGGVGAKIIYGRKIVSHNGTPGGKVSSKPMGTNFSKPARVLITGSRNLNDSSVVHKVLNEELWKRGSLHVVHGGAKGADSIAGTWAQEMKAKGFPVTFEVHPANWNAHGKAAGPIRNQKMVDLGADIVFAFPRGASPGTRHAIKIARIAGIRVKEF